MIKLTSETFDENFCKIIENNIKICEEYAKLGIKIYLIPLYPLERRKEND